MIEKVNGLIYLASPYSAPTTRQRNARYKKVCRKAAELMLEGHEVFCPIAHSHPIETIGMTERQNGDWWLKQDFAVLEHCKKLVVYKMKGWENSYGIKREIDFAELAGIPVEFIEDD
jgi:nucleoside 2-deoxyribosyltransferase